LTLCEKETTQQFKQKLQLGMYASKKVMIL
jgi:hypothetical protein